MINAILEYPELIINDGDFILGPTHCLHLPCRSVIPSLQAMHNLDIARSIHCVPLHNVNISCIFV